MRKMGSALKPGYDLSDLPPSFECLPTRPSPTLPCPFSPPATRVELPLIVPFVPTIVGIGIAGCVRARCCSARSIADQSADIQDPLPRTQQHRRQKLDHEIRHRASLEETGNRVFGCCLVNVVSVGLSAGLL